MQKIAFYRKYRPENFAQTLGQEHITKVLQNAVNEKKISHAYLFSGPRGTGKTSVARILAKAINCQSEKEKPCGKCPICIGISEGRIMDLLEIDAASNRGIDEIRDLREKVKFSPTEGNYKVFIIDEVHMLTKEAFNALLKTLEEPPEHAIFILATTEINKVPATIISRCQRHDFKRIRLNDIVAKLSEIKKAEKIEISDEALELVAETSEGGLRDAISLLDQLGSVGITKVEVADVENILGLAPHRLTIDFVKNLLNKDAKQGLLLIEKAAESGVDLVILTKSALELTRKLLSLKVTGGENLEGTKEQIEEYKTIIEEKSIEDIVYFSDCLIETQSAFKTNVEPKAVLTILCAKAAMEKIEAKPVQTEAPKASAQPEKPAASKTATKISPNGKWQHFLMEIKAKNNTLHAFLRVAVPEFEDENNLNLTFPYKFHKERIEESKNKRMVEELLTKVYGCEINLHCKMDGEHRNQKVSDVNQAASILGGEVVD